MGIGSKLTQIMKEQNTNANELAAKAGIPAQTVYSLIRRDASKVDIDTLIKIARALGVTAEYFCSDNAIEEHTHDIHFNEDKCTNEDLEMIKKYISLSATGKEHINFLINQTYDSENHTFCDGQMTILEAFGISPDMSAEDALKKISGYIDDTSKQPTTIAAHFDGDEYTDEELNKIKEFTEFVKSNKK